MRHHQQLVSSLLLATVAILFITTTNGEFFGKKNSNLFLNENHLNEKIRLADRDQRLADRDFRIENNRATELATTAADLKEYEIWMERGSKYMEDGVQLIPENNKKNRHACDPRMPVCFGDIDCKVVKESMMKFPITEYKQLKFDSVDIETVESGFILVSAMGKGYHTVTRRDEFLELFNANEKKNQLVRIVCESCDERTHREVFYRRITDPPVDLLSIIESDWRSSDNVHESDFDLYSSYSDAVSETNAWTYCGGFDNSTYHVGFPGNCGPDGPVWGQYLDFTTRINQLDVSIYVVDATANETFFDRPLWEVETELEFEADREFANELDSCKQIPQMDMRRACWRACDAGEASNNIGAAKLCSKLQVFGDERRVLRERYELDVYGEGEPRGSFMKPTHPLGALSSES